MAKKKTKPSKKSKKEAVNTLNLIKTDISAPVPEAKIVEVVVDTCWMVNFEEEITTPNPIDNYYQMLNKDHMRIWTTSFKERFYKLSICFKPIKSNEEEPKNPQSELDDPMTEVGITIRFRVSEPQPHIYENGDIAKVTKKDFDEVRKKFEAGVNIFNNRFNLIIKDPLCGEKKLPIRFLSNWVKSQAHFGIYVLNRGERASNVYEGIKIPVDSPITEYAHELGHGFGLADEYMEYSRFYVKYIKPDGKLDEELNLVDLKKGTVDPQKTLYSCRECMLLKPRHGWPIAIEVQKLLRRNIRREKGQEITCDIEMV
jgi:hypothetical protein